MYLVHGIVPSDEIIISLVASIAKMVYIHIVQVHIYKKLLQFVIVFLKSIILHCFQNSLRLSLFS